jgi:hypothetical protein
MQPERFIHAALPVAFQVKGNVMKSQIFHFGNDFQPELIIRNPFNLSR